MIFRKLMCAVLAISFFLLPLNSVAEVIVEQPAFLDDVRAEGTENNYNKFHTVPWLLPPRLPIAMYSSFDTLLQHPVIIKLRFSKAAVNPMRLLVTIWQ